LKNPNRTTVSRLVDLPNVGEKIAADLRIIGIDHPRQLIGKNPFTLYKKLCSKTGHSHDPCVIDVFISAVHFMEDGEPQPWWLFTEERKKHFIKNQRKN